MNLMILWTCDVFQNATSLHKAGTHTDNIIHQKNSTYHENAVKNKEKHWQGLKLRLHKHKA